jgi:transposase
MNYRGIDLHSNNSVVSVIDETDRVVAERRLPNDLAKILALLAPWRAGLAGVVVESTYNWYWLVDGLQAAGFAVHLANTRMPLWIGQRIGVGHRRFRWARIACWQCRW